MVINIIYNQLLITSNRDNLKVDEAGTRYCPPVSTAQYQSQPRLGFEEMGANKNIANNKNLHMLKIKDYLLYLCDTLNVNI